MSDDLICSYLNNGEGSSLVCFINDTMCLDNDWIEDDDDPTSGTPNCIFVVGDTVDNSQTTNNSCEANWIHFSQCLKVNKVPVTCTYIWKLYAIHVIFLMVVKTSTCSYYIVLH